MKRSNLKRSFQRQLAIYVLSLQRSETVTTTKRSWTQIRLTKDREREREKKRTYVNTFSKVCT